VDIRVHSFDCASLISVFIREISFTQRTRSKCDISKISSRGQWKW